MVAHGSTKRVRLSKTATPPSKASSFTTGREVQEFFRSNNQGLPVDAINVLRNQISLIPGEVAVPAHDVRLLLVKEWLELSPGAYDVFTVLEKGPQPAVAAICLSILTSLLMLTSQHFVYQPLGQVIIKKLLTSQWLRKLDSYLSSVYSELCLAALKLLNAVSSFAGGKEQKNLLEALSWDVKVFHRLLYMRRKGKNADHDILTRPDIRTLCLQFILSFLSSSSHVKTMFLEQHRDIFLSTFKGLSSDQHSVVRYVLEILWTNLWQDQKIKRTLKVGFFGETSIQHLVKLYERSAQEGSNSEDVPADVAHHFLLAICTHRGVGICFADNGWYPRRENEDEVSQKGGKFHNKILATVLKMLKVNDDVRQQELALKIMRACPELVAGYFQSVGLTLEPRLSSKWLANIAFLGAVVSLPVPVDSFCLPKSTAGSSFTPTQFAYQPAPPPLLTVIENILPSMSLKVHLSKALQSPSALIQHAAGLTLVRCLRKWEAVREAFRTVETALEEDEIEGQWTRRLIEIEREVRRRVPEFNVIVAFYNTQQASAAPTIKSAMLTELAQRLLWLYHRCVPSLASEARYDIAKSLRSFLDIENIGVNVSAGIDGLNRLQQLHVLRMLSESNQFIWHAKPTPSAPSNIYILFSLFFKTEHASIRETLSTLLIRVLKDSLLFQHDPEELHIWLNALPGGVRSIGGETPDGVPLKDERECVASFLDTCMQRCAKTPHRYIEEMNTLVVSSGDAVRSISASPILITVLEQLGAKMRSGSLEPSDALALTTFVRKVIVGLLGKQADAEVFWQLATNLAAAVTGDGIFAKFPVVIAALRKECEILDACIERCSSVLRTKRDEPGLAPSDALMDFVAQVEALQHVNGETLVSQAYELVDWMRLVDQPLSSEIVNRVVSVIKRFHAPALSSFYLHLCPGSKLLWSTSDEDLANWVPDDWIILHTDTKQLATPRCISVIQAVFKRGRRSLYEYECLTGLLIHRLDGQCGYADADSVLEVLTLLVEGAKNELSLSDFSALKNFILAERQHIKLLSCADDLSDSVTSALGRLLDLTIDGTSASDCLLVSSICKHWTTSIGSSLERKTWRNLSCSLIWISFMPFDDLLSLTEQLLRCFQPREDSDHTTVDDQLLQLADALFSSLVYHHNENLPASWLNQNLGAFLRLRKSLPTAKALEKVISLSVGASIPLGCDGFRFLTEVCSLQSVVSMADAHWASRLSRLPRHASVNALLSGSDWSVDISCAVASFIYRCPDTRRSFWSWISSGELSGKPALGHLAPAIHALFDSCLDEELCSVAEDPFVMTLFNALTKEIYSGPMQEHDAQVYGTCLAKMMRGCPSKRRDFNKILCKRTSALSVHALHFESLRLVRLLVDVSGEDLAPFAEAVFGHALQWAVRHLTENPESSDVHSDSLDSIADVVRLGKAIAPHFAEPVIAAAIHHHLCHSQSIRLAEALFANTILKPVNVNRHLQSILQHAHFGRLVASDPACEEREWIAKLLFTVFHTHPANTCQPSHIQPLIQLYSGSLSFADCQIFAIFHLFEEQRKNSVASIVAQWSQARTTYQQTSLGAILNMDSARVLQTCLSFPVRRIATIHGGHDMSASGVEDGLVYDPVFLLLLFAQTLFECPPQSALSWVSLYRTNIVSLVIRCLSSADSKVRKIALLQLGTLCTLMQTADIQEKEHVIHLLDLLRNQLHDPADQASEEETLRLPSYTTLLLAHALRGVFYPANFIYPLTARFLLQRPELDGQDVPMLYGMLYSSGDNWRKERYWMVRFLANGMSGSEDWRLLKRRHTWDLLASLFQQAYGDRPLRHLILEVLANLTSQAQAATSQILRSSLVQWMEMQLLTMQSDDSLAWAKIIENILVVADTEQIEQATGGEWQAGLLRCLTSLTIDADVTLLRLIARTMSRLTSRRLQHSLNIRRALELALGRLRAFERSANLSPSNAIRRRTNGMEDVLPPHRSFRLHQAAFESNTETWGKVVESLWSVSLKLDAPGPVYDQLTHRLLLWRASCGEKVSPVGEWARKHTILCLSLVGT